MCVEEDIAQQVEPRYHLIDRQALPGFRDGAADPLGDGLRCRRVVHAEGHGLKDRPAVRPEPLRDEPVQGARLVGPEVRAASTAAGLRPDELDPLDHGVLRRLLLCGPLPSRAGRRLPHRPVLVDLEGLRPPLLAGVALREGKGPPPVVEVQGVLQVLPVRQHEGEPWVGMFALQQKPLEIPALEGHELGSEVYKAPHGRVSGQSYAEGLCLIEARLPPRRRLVVEARR
mmetsp:Transcript_62705/g.202255  ORF Transcript_62705/g.202255 Transcript_62705/m.202255 type:complete len:229 (-) Transcript_62705:442-1128(-)